MPQIEARSIRFFVWTLHLILPPCLICGPTRTLEAVSTPGMNASTNRIQAEYRHVLDAKRQLIACVPVYFFSVESCADATICRGKSAWNAIRKTTSKIATMYQGIQAMMRSHSGVQRSKQGKGTFGFLMVTLPSDGLGLDDVVYAHEVGFSRLDPNHPQLCGEFRLPRRTLSMSFEQDPRAPPPVKNWKVLTKMLVRNGGKGPVRLD